MSGGDVPVWATVTLAAMSGGLGFAGAVLSARTTARTHERELAQEQLLHGENARLEALDDAAVTAIDYRERVAAALTVLATNHQWLDIEALWSFGRPDVMVFLRHDAALTLRFGREHEVCEKWRALGWMIGGAAFFAGEHRHWQDSPDLIPAEVSEQAQGALQAIRKSLDEFLKVASAPFERVPQSSRPSPSSLTESRWRYWFLGDAQVGKPRSPRR